MGHQVKSVNSKDSKTPIENLKDFNWSPIWTRLTSGFSFHKPSHIEKKKTLSATRRFCIPLLYMELEQSWEVIGMDPMYVVVGTITVLDQIRDEVKMSRGENVGLEKFLKSLNYCLMQRNLYKIVNIKVIHPSVVNISFIDFLHKFINQINFNRQYCLWCIFTFYWVDSPIFFFNVSLK